MLGRFVARGLEKCSLRDDSIVTLFELFSSKGWTDSFAYNVLIKQMGEKFEKFDSPQIMNLQHSMASLHMSHPEIMSAFLQKLKEFKLLNDYIRNVNHRVTFLRIFRDTNVQGHEKQHKEFIELVERLP